MLRVECHSVITLAFSNTVSADNFISLRVDDCKDILILKIDVNFAGNWIILWHPGFAVEMQSLNDFVLLHINDSLRFSALIGNIELVEGGCIGASIRLCLCWQL